MALVTLPLAAVTSRQATTVALWTSRPAQRGYNTLRLIAGTLPFCYTSRGRRSGGRRDAPWEHKFPPRTHGEAVVTLSTAGGARISLKHGLGGTQSRRSRLAAAYSYCRASAAQQGVGSHAAHGARRREPTAVGVTPFSSSSLTPRVIALET